MRQKRSVPGALASCALMFLFACGGGNGDDVSPPSVPEAPTEPNPEPDPTPDAPPPAPTPAPTPELRGDRLARQACDGTTSAATEIDAAETFEDAHSAELRPGDRVYTVHLPQGAMGYAVVNIPHDHGDWGVFVDHPDLVLALDGGELGRFEVRAERPNEACPGLLRVDSRHHIHAAGPWVLEFAEDGPREVQLQILSQIPLPDDEADDLTIEACEAFDHGEVSERTAHADPADAMAETPIRPEELSHLLLPDGVESYVPVLLPADHTDWAIFADEPGVAIRLASDDLTFDISPDAPSLACGESIAVDVRVHIHTGGLYLLELAADGPREVAFLLVSAQEGHDDDGEHDDGEHDDGGHDDGGHDDGGHDDG